MRERASYKWLEKQPRLLHEAARKIHTLPKSCHINSNCWSKDSRPVQVASPMEAGGDGGRRRWDWGLSVMKPEEKEVGALSPGKVPDRFFYVFRDKHSFAKCAVFLWNYLTVLVLAAFEPLPHRFLLGFSIPVLHPYSHWVLSFPTLCWIERLMLGFQSKISIPLSVLEEVKKKKR